MSVDASKILLLCDRWLQSGGDDRYRLLNNGIAFDELPYEEIRAACLGLTRVLLLPGRNTIIDQDHRFFWSWSGEVLAGARPAFVSDDEPELLGLMKLLFHAALASDACGTDSHAAEVLRKRHVLVVYLAFPVLEGFLKKKCGRYVNPAGVVLQSFKVPTSSGGRRPYRPGKRCSSVHDLLWLLYEEVADAELVDGLDALCEHLSQFGTGHPFEVIYQWRNTSLHGSSLLPTIGGTILNTAILIALNAVRESYESIRLRAARRSAFFASTASPRTPWSFYPPD
jgi:hypothetical protein